MGLLLTAAEVVCNSEKGKLFVLLLAFAKQLENALNIRVIYYYGHNGKGSQLRRNILHISHVGILSK